MILEKKKHARGVKLDVDLPADALKELVREFKAEIRKRTGQPFPDDPMEQLWGAIGAVFGSWMNERAIVYRQLNGIPSDWGTAVSVQSMVFGNLGDDCGTGVAFTRDPATGEDVFYGEYLINAQGEDVVAGVRTPQRIATLKERMPAIYRQLLEIRKTLESHYRDMQDIEFTVERGKLFMLQTRTGKRTGFAEVRIAVEMADRKLITPEEAVLRVNPDSLNQLLRPIFDPAKKREAIEGGKFLARGLNAGPGAASGRIVFTALDAFEWAARGEKVLLVREETSPEDIKGMNASEGILTARGGMTSHAALVGRQMGKVCVVGCEAIHVDARARTMTVKEKTFKEGDWLSLDGTTGEVLEGKLATMPSEVLQVVLEKSLDPKKSQVYRLYAKLMGWADAARRMKVRANADQPDQAANAVAFGGEGIGLCRTEHMFFGEGRIVAMREMILADSVAEREKALAKILPMQREDFIGIFRAMGPRPVTIRTLDPPLHEFLPHTPAEQEEVARQAGVPVEKVARKVADLHEMNPMLGHRGCRLGITFPEITRMQARAILEAACRVRKEKIAATPEIMIPLVGHVRELEDQAQIVRDVAEEVFKAEGIRVPYLVGTMIELPARGRDGRRDRDGGRVLQLRDERPDADDVRPFARRRGEVPPRVRQAGDPPLRPVREAGPGGRREADGVGRHLGTRHPAEPEGGDLRRARRRAVERRVLPPDEARLRLLLALPDPDRPPRGGAGSAEGEGGGEGREETREEAAKKPAKKAAKKAAKGKAGRKR